MGTGVGGGGGSRPEMALDNHPSKEKLQIEVVEIFIVQLKRTLEAYELNASSDSLIELNAPVQSPQGGKVLRAIWHGK